MTWRTTPALYVDSEQPQLSWLPPPRAVALVDRNTGFGRVVSLTHDEAAPGELVLSFEYFISNYGSGHAAYNWVRVGCMENLTVYLVSDLDDTCRRLFLGGR